MEWAIPSVEIKDSPRFGWRGLMLDVSRHFYDKDEVKELLDGIRKANLTIRNFPATVAEVRKRLKLGEGGETYLFATTLNDGRKILLRCSKT